MANTNGEAEIINAASPSREDVGAAIQSAQDGDSVLVPAGTASWTTTLEISKAITLQGAGIGQTILTDNIQKDKSGRSEAIFVLDTEAGKSYRLTGFEFRRGRESKYYEAVVQLWGQSSQVRVDHCKWVNPANRGLFVRSAVLGVIDHCRFEMSGTHAIAFFQSGLFGGSYGDGSYENPVDWGGPGAMYVEDCHFENSGYGSFDAFGGSRIVFRHNTVVDSRIGVHGTESTQRFRGARSLEIYENTFLASKHGDVCIDLRSGTAAIFNNTITGSYNNTIKLSNYRNFASFTPWGGADGMNGFDLNVPGGPFEAGTATSADSLSMTDSSKDWPPNQWKGYVLRNKTTGRFSEIISNTSDTISFMSGGGFSTGNMAFSVGDAYDLRKVLAALDQPGRGLCEPLSGSPPTPEWPNQMAEPIYQWNNQWDRGSVSISTGCSTIQEGREYHNNMEKPGYTPYVYPHPLVSGVASNEPHPPTGLRVESGL